MKFLNKIIKYIKNIFIGSKELNINTDSTTIEEKADQKIETIEVGDIIWAKRYKNEKDMEKILEGHREGPYIVLKKDIENLICSQGTSVTQSEDDYEVYFNLNNEGYSLTKETFFKLYRMDFINNYQVIKVLDKLNEKDKNILFRQIKLLHKVYYTKEGYFIKLDLPIQIGDIVNRNNKKFIVVDINDNKIICLNLNNEINFNDNRQLKYINFSNLDYSKINYFELDNNIKYINTVNNKIIKIILNEWKEYINNLKDVEKTQRGSIIIKNNKYYYVYGEEGTEWLVFEISKMPLKDADQIQIGSSKYYTKYIDLKINKKDIFSNLYICSEKDKDKIKQLRKSYKKAEKNENSYEIPKSELFNVGDIIEDINYKDERYIIIRLCKKTYECLSIEKIKLGIFDNVFIKKVDSKFSSNTTLDGIKWVEDNPAFKLSNIAEQGNLDKMFETQIRYLEELYKSNELKKLK